MISIIVPCYNEQEALPLFHKEVTRVLQEMGESYELLLVTLSHSGTGLFGGGILWSMMAPEIAHWT